MTPTTVRLKDAWLYATHDHWKPLDVEVSLGDLSSKDPDEEFRDYVWALPLLGNPRDLHFEVFEQCRDEAPFRFLIRMTNYSADYYIFAADLPSKLEFLARYAAPIAQAAIATSVPDDEYICDDCASSAAKPQLASVPKEATPTPPPPELALGAPVSSGKRAPVSSGKHPRKVLPFDGPGGPDAPQAG
jgi:hypothetical protein